MVSLVQKTSNKILSLQTLPCPTQIKNAENKKPSQDDIAKEGYYRVLTDYSKIQINLDKGSKAPSLDRIDAYLLNPYSFLNKKFPL